MLIVLVLLYISFIATGASVSVSDKRELQRLVDENPVVLLKLCASFHPPCIPIIHVWAEVAATLQRAEAVVADFDGSPSEELPKYLGVKEVPTLRYYVNGTEGEYRGDFVAKDIVLFARGLHRPEFESAESLEKILELQRQHSVALVKFGEAEDDASAEATFTEVARVLRGMAAFVRAPLSSRPSQNASPFVIWTIDGDARDLHVSLYNDSARLSHAVRVARMEALAELLPETYDEYLRLQLPLVWVFTSRSDCEKDDGICAITRAMASSFRGRACFFWVDSSKYGMVAGRLGLKGRSFPAISVDVDQTHHFPYDENAPMTHSAVQEFVESVLRGSIQPTIMSDPAPEEHTVQGLTTVVGSTLNELLYDDKLDVIIEFTSSECTECSGFDEAYEEIARDFSPRGVRVARMDVDRNDYGVRTFTFTRIPAFYFVKRGSRKAELYRGAADEDELRSYILSRMTDRDAVRDEL